MDTYFIRHTRDISIDDPTRSAMIENDRIFIHYPDYADGLHDEDNATIDPDQHDKRGRYVVRRFVELARNGGYVCAEYHGLKGWIVGFVEPGTEPEIMEGRWRDWDRIARLKTIKLTKARSITEGAGAAMLSARPRMGSFMRWHRAGRSVIRLVDGLTEELTLADLSSDQQEVLCSEFLRSEEAKALGLPILAHLVLPTGRTMRDIDILGIATDGKQLVAQVTYAHRSQIQGKFDRLLPFAQTGHTVLFCDASEISVEQGVHIVPLGKAYEVFALSLLGQKWLSVVLPDKSESIANWRD